MKQKGSQRSAVSDQPKSGGVGVSPAAVKNIRYPQKPERIVQLGRKSPLDGLVMEEDVGRDDLPQDDVAASRAASAALGFRDDAHGIWLYQGNCLAILDAIYAKYGEAGCFDMVFAARDSFESSSLSCVFSDRDGPNRARLASQRQMPHHAIAKQESLDLQLLQC